MRNQLVAMAIAALLACGPAYAEEPAAPSTQLPAPQAQAAPDQAPSLSELLGQMEEMVDAAKAFIKTARDSSGLIVEGAGILDTIRVEAGKIAEMEAKCLEGDDAQCAKAKRERCPQLTASYKAIQGRIDAFDKKVAESTFPPEVKSSISLISMQVSDGIKMLKEQLEKGHCTDA